MVKMFRNFKIYKILIAFFCVFFLSSANAKYINGISAIIDGEIITDYDIQKLIDALKISPSQALNILIRQKLEDAQIKAMEINPSEIEINAQMSQIGARSGFKDWSEFEKALKNQGVNINDFRAQVKNNIALEKLYSNITNRPNANITQENARRFYQNNKSLFSRFINATITQYSSQNAQDLENLKAKKPNNALSAKAQKISATSTDARLVELVANTKIGDFTPIIPQGGFYVMFKINDKDGIYTPNFEDIEENVAQAMIAQEKEAMIEDYFNKLRVSANIQIIKR
ncbi:MAG: putative chaperone (SurA domain) [Candidatus Campylobacter infans]|nr:MAG: putative chaperone (SurA domain) [Candidatus Campylobacter infans]